MVTDLRSEARFPRGLNLLREKGLRSYCWVPLTIADKRLGAFGLGSSRLNAYTERDMRLLPRVAELVAVAVENALSREAWYGRKKTCRSCWRLTTHWLRIATCKNCFRRFPVSFAG